MTYKDKIQAYYTRQAAEHGEKSTSTMPDLAVRELEVAAIIGALHRLTTPGSRPKLLELGCGNGFLLSCIAEEFGDSFELFGVDFTVPLLEEARGRDLDCEFVEGTLPGLPFDDDFLDIVISERVIINLLDEEEQVETFRELARVLRPGGRAVHIEGFKSGWENSNRAREEFCLEPIPEPDVNNWFTEERWQRFLDCGFDELSGDEVAGLAPENFLSSHYFMTRFFHDIIRPVRGKLRNTEFAKFFAQALPPVGDYSPLRIKYLRRIPGEGAE